MVNNSYNFRDDNVRVDSLNDVDYSNTINGKPIYYCINKRDLEVPHDVGYVALVESTNITVRNLNLKNNGLGVLLLNTNSSTIVQNNISNNVIGIKLHDSYNNKIYENNIVKNAFFLTGENPHTGSSNNAIYHNNFVNSGAHALVQTFGMMAIPLEGITGATMLV